MPLAPRPSDLARSNTIRTAGQTLWLATKDDPLQIPYLVRNVLCPDHCRRTAYLTTLQPDTFYSWPARAHWAGHWHTGFVTVNDDNTDTHFIENNPHA